MARQLLAVLAITTVHLVVCTNDTETNNIEVNAEEDSVGPSWMYKCESEDGCHRVSRPLPTNMTQAGQLYDNMDLCRMACGRFGGLWPRPMTAALSAQTVQIHPNYLRFEGGLRETANILRLLQEYPGAAGSLRGEARPHAVAGGCPQHIERNVAKSFSKTTLIPVSSAFTGCAILSIQCSTYYDNYMTCGSPLSSSMVSLMIWFDLIDAPPPTRDLLAEMSQILTQNLEAECGGQVTTVVETPVVIYINVKSSDLSLNWFTDESYILDMQSRGTDVAVHIVAETVFGIRHGLETLSQMVSSNRSQTPHSKECGLQLIAGAKIRDKPMYPHRGLVLDTSRNFIPIEAIKKTVDGMGASKMNVLHWHATDSHSFPLESPRVPLLTKYGAYSASEIYRVDEVTDLLKYARARGVRVILEIDSPAHAGNGWQWGEEYGLGELAVCVNAKPWRPLCIQPPCGQLNPANPNLYPILRDLYRDIAETWPLGELFHMGGDEVFMNCWNSSEEITSYMKNKGFERTTEGFIRLWAEFHAAILGIWDEETKDIGAIGNAPVMLWSSELTQPMRIQNFLNKDRYVIQVWEPETSPLLTQLSRLGYRVVASPKDVWYLDHGFWGTTKYANWRRMYMHMLPREPNVLGGEVAMWSEYVDANGLDARIWPRAAAVAERLWADPLGTTAGRAEPRMQRHRARLVARGLRPDVLSPQWCAQHDSRCV